MDAECFLDAAEMTDRLATVLDRDKWDRVIIPELGSVSQFFAHMVRVRDVYRDGLISGEISFLGRFVSGDADLEKD